MPLETFLIAVYPDCQIVLFADGNLAGVQDTLCAAVEFNQAVAVIVVFPAADEGTQLRADMSNFKACDIFGQVCSVGADVADTTAAAV